MPCNLGKGSAGAILEAHMRGQQQQYAEEEEKEEQEQGEEVDFRIAQLCEEIEQLEMSRRAVQSRTKRGPTKKRMKKPTKRLTKKAFVKETESADGESTAFLSKKLQHRSVELESTVSAMLQTVRSSLQLSASYLADPSSSTKVSTRSQLLFQSHPELSAGELLECSILHADILIGDVKA